jgi:hypothetical protein
MRTSRAAFAADPRSFGRARARADGVLPQSGWTLPDDLKLFSATFAAGFLFVSIFLA